MILNDVQTIFSNLHNHEIENFVVLWDFLNKRFFLHLDAEHGIMCAHLKSDLIKYYLVYCVKNKCKEKILDFFNHYSYEILSESSPLTSGNLRHWYTLPYVDEPEKDNEFSVYFSTRWMELLRITLHNFLTIVFASSSPPKLLLLEKWFRTDKQLEMRSQLKLLNDKIELILTRFEKYEDRLQNLRETVRILSSYIQNNLHMQQFSSSNRQNTMGKGGGVDTGDSSSGLFDNGDDELSPPPSSTQQTGSTSKHGSRRGSAATTAVDLNKLREVEQSVSRISAECARKTAILGNLPKDQRMKEVLGEIYSLSSNNLSPTHEMHEYLHSSHSTYHPNASYSSNGTGYISSRRELEEMETDLISKVQEWVSMLKNEHV